MLPLTAVGKGPTHKMLKYNSTSLYKKQVFFTKSYREKRFRKSFRRFQAKHAFSRFPYGLFLYSRRLKLRTAKEQD